MLPSKNRLRKRKDIDRVFLGKKSVKNGALVCRVILNNGDNPRFCFIVSKRISNKAVVRNKLKRRLRSIVAKFLPQIKVNYDCVFIACPGLELVDFRCLVSIVERVLLSLGGIGR